MYILIFILILIILILVHEYGHFIVAKKSGIRVDEFGIGFPPRALKLFTRKGTLYSLNWIPFGGFVKIFGENPDDDSISGPDRARALVNKPRIVQAAVLLAGIIFNVLLAWVLFSAVFMVGLHASTSAFAPGFVQNPELTLTDVLTDTPAEKAGLHIGDTILSASYKSESIANPTPEAFQDFIHAHANLPIVITVRREGRAETLTVTPSIATAEKPAMIGVSLDEIGFVKLPFFRALIFGAKTTVHESGNIVGALGGLLGGAVKGHPDLSSVAGPVGIVGLVKMAIELGFVYLLYFVALISINLAVINLLPFPALDGGRLLFLIIEAIKGSRLNPKFANYANTIGFCLLILLMIVITVHDVTKLF